MLPERIAEVRDWLARARLDARAAEHLLADGVDLAEPALFHCQQAAEKALKAFLVWHDRTFTRTHNLVALLNLCADVESDFTSLQAAAVALTPYAVAFRYPGELPAPTAEQAEEALQLMREVLTFVLERLPAAATD
jgi:HEPN domain-containing protein